ncbi:tafazzin [Macadamia integrifolia]|uniref:tafazzin n=1 Tax=Macadamia integrifolia TaxID=60698 RepID=UPI001C4FA2B3|nr:tafazzin [Macadamia integrifolia]
MMGDWVDRGDLWKNRARALQLRIRDRFRVAVHGKRRRTGFSDGYLSASLQRWITRLRKLRRDSLPASSAFYRKRVNRDIDAVEDSVIMRMLQALAVPVIGNVCHVFMHGFNHIQIYGAEKLHQALQQRPEGKPLITVSNHVASVDDPLVIASLLPPSLLLDAHSLRWTLCATDRCFKNPVTSAFFRCVKVLPVSRGDGVYQKGLDMALSKLNNGGWVHIFPEGSRSRDGGKTMGSAKRGVGRLVMDADTMPVVVPFVHTGMQDIMPIGSSFPKIGKTVTVLIGDPIQFDDLLLTVDDTQEVSRAELYDAITSRVGHRLNELKVQVDRLALEQSLQVEGQAVPNAQRANGLLQQVDWEAFGMSSYIQTEDHSFLRPAIQTHLEVNHDQGPGFTSSDRYFRMGFSYESGIVSRIRGYMDPTELMGFAAKGLFMKSRIQEHKCTSFREIAPLRVWKQFLEANILQQWSRS